MEFSEVKREQREYVRYHANCLTYVHGRKRDGRNIKVSTLSDNISSGGLYMQLPYSFDTDSEVFTFTRLLNGVGLAAKSRVVRVDKTKGDLSGVALCFSRYRLITNQLMKREPY